MKPPLVYIGSNSVMSVRKSGCFHESNRTAHSDALVCEAQMLYCQDFHPEIYDKNAGFVNHNG